tara:strand:- start:385 stop:669 length:285 start_codon:yes stop_codon:yes gene_type:complete
MAQVTALMKKFLRRVDKYLGDAQKATSRSTNVFGVWTQNKNDLRKDFMADLKTFSEIATMLNDESVLTMVKMQAKKVKDELIADCDSIIGEDGD